MHTENTQRKEATAYFIITAFQRIKYSYRIKSCHEYYYLFANSKNCKSIVKLNSVKLMYQNPVLFSVSSPSVHSAQLQPSSANLSHKSRLNCLQKYHKSPFIQSVDGGLFFAFINLIKYLKNRGRLHYSKMTKPS